MWICLNNAFLSIVSKECANDELLVRARRKEHITAVFPDANVRESFGTDYQFRANVNRKDVAMAIAQHIERITYGNFKDSVRNKPLHDAYMGIWTIMSKLQPKPPYSRPNNRQGRMF